MIAQRIAVYSSNALVNKALYGFDFWNKTRQKSYIEKNAEINKDC